MLPWRPKASEELAAGYATAAELSERRSEAASGAGRQDEAKIWSKLAEYCTDMARTRAVDDDQFKFMRDKLRHRREISLDAPELEFLAVRDHGEPPEWKLAVLELVLGSLSPIQRVCYELVIGGRVRIGDVAEALGEPKSKIYNHINAAKRKIRKEIVPRIRPIIDGARPG